MNLQNIEFDHRTFLNDFLNRYLEHGFTSLSKKETDLLILQLLLRYHPEWSEDNPPNAFELAKALRVKRGKIRSMLDELSFRNSGNEDLILRKLRELLKNAEIEFDNNKVRMQIEDAYIREYAKDIVHKDYGMTDTSFNRSIITLSGDKFLALVSEVVSDDKLEEFKNKLETNLPSTERSSLVRVFLENFVSSAGKEAGKKAIKLGTILLDGGLSELSEVIESIKRLGSKDND